MKHLFKKSLLALALSAGLNLSLAADAKIAIDSEPVSFDIHVQLSGGILHLSHLVFDPLVRFKQDMTFENRLATNVEQMDATTVRVTLRQGVQFHSGNPFTADDVLWTFERLKRSADFKGIFTPIVEMRKIDDFTVDVVTDGPYPLLMNLLTYVFPMDSKFYTGQDANGKDKAAIDKTITTFADVNASGTGAFKAAKHEPGVAMTLVRNANYWDKDSKGNVDNLNLVVIKENATRVAALLSGDVDMIHPVAPTEHDRVKSAKGIDMITMGGTRIITVQMNQKTAEPLRNEKVRQAIVYAVNNQGIVDKIMRGFATATGQMSPKGYLGYSDSIKPRFDLDKAKQLMKDAGYEKGFELTMISPNDRYLNDEKVAQTIAAMLAKINIKVNLKTMPKAQYWTEFDKCEADLSLIGWHSDTEDSANLSESLLMTRDAKTGKGQYNCGHYSNARVDELLVKSNIELDVAKRTAMLQEIEQIIHNEAAYVPLYFQNLSWAAKSNLNAKDVVNVMDYPYYGDLIVK